MHNECGANSEKNTSATWLHIGLLIRVLDDAVILQVVQLEDLYSGSIRRRPHF